ncbi:WD40/YVTN repeat-like-containing domain [Plasmopara halstedii]|uniref:WD40/YVTN repeat-like-containing domain n=1 Tax=Plasmopara halstedii TaxID=4781 RepID=A0A0P1AX75_PLAHL|nr:WD40/YVTN repeat-like-containing domain [Plasmopara halstedii]CEG46017.1 WD40/YVTN repeat-like-containing domain [Plasmopara halstedii]|eukprot:XP_024582386.1 WD40/YVTN repeat-like-containing domain [Plasmopara halstedii]
MPQGAVTFKGHCDSVNTLLCDESVHPNVLASGSDDGTCRLWDLRTTRVSKCFHIKRALGTQGSESAYIYVAAGNKVLTFDVRQPALIVEHTDRPIFQQNEDEINTLSRHPGKNGKFLSAPDDAGNICVYDIESHQLFKKLNGQHTNICSAAPFRPNAPWDLVSGGMDGLLLFWDFSRGRLKFSIDLNTGLNGLGDSALTKIRNGGTQQMVNPPLVHSLVFAPNGKSFVAGLGDASIAVVNFNSKQIVRRLEHHSAMVSQVHFPAFRAEDRLVSVANDAKVCIWDYQAALTPDIMISGDHLSSNSYLVTEFALPKSPNAITTTYHQNWIVVADMSKEIKAYSAVER